MRHLRVHGTLECQLVEFEKFTWGLTWGCLKIRDPQINQALFIGYEATRFSATSFGDTPT